MYAEQAGLQLWEREQSFRYGVFHRSKLTGYRRPLKVEHLIKQSLSSPDSLRVAGLLRCKGNYNHVPAGAAQLLLKKRDLAK